MMENANTVLFPTNNSAHQGNSSGNWIPGGGGGYSAWKLMGVCRWPLKIGPQKIEEKIEFGAKKIVFVKIGSFCTPKDSFAVGGWEKYPKKIVLDPAKVKKGGQNRGTYVSPIT